MYTHQGLELIFSYSRSLPLPLTSGRSQQRIDFHSKRVFTRIARTGGCVLLFALPPDVQRQPPPAVDNPILITSNLLAVGMLGMVMSALTEFDHALKAADTARHLAILLGRYNLPVATIPQLPVESAFGH